MTDIDMGNNASASSSKDTPVVALRNEMGKVEQYRFEQYKLYVELMDRTSQRRMAANTFYLSVNTALITVAAWFKNDFGQYMYLVSAIGVLIALLWFFSIRSHAQPNKGKFKVIREIEESLPLNLFAYELELLGKGKSPKAYLPLSHVERVVPFVLIAMYVALSILVTVNSVEVVK
jgi:hypothetical protein